MAKRVLFVLTLLATVAVAGCAGVPSQPRQRGRLDIAHASSSKLDGSKVARYDWETGTCSSHSIQLLSSEAVDALVDGWKEPKQGCDGPEKTRLPSYGDDPGSTRDMHDGSAQVLVRLKADGRVESINAVCATNAAIGEAAVETVRRIRFSPMTCGGSPTRVAFLLPLDYEFY